MDETDMGFRTVLVGGFHRDDVIEYIKKQTQENAQRVDELRQENDELLEQNEALNRENDKLSKNNAELSKRIEAMTTQIDKLKTEISDRENLVKLADDETAEQNKLYNEMLDKFKEFKVKYQELEKENAALLDKIDELVQKTKEFDRDRAYIADIELNAHKRADEIEQKANQKAQHIIYEAEQKAEKIKAKAEKTRFEYCKTLKQTKQSISDVINQLENPQNNKSETHGTLNDMLTNLKKGQQEV